MEIIDSQPVTKLLETASKYPIIVWTFSLMILAFAETSSGHSMSTLLPSTSSSSVLLAREMMDFPNVRSCDTAKQHISDSLCKEKHAILLNFTTNLAC
jgi:hypothetical protein